MLPSPSSWQRRLNACKRRGVHAARQVLSDEAGTERHWKKS
ncbi:MAG: hypothetical protein ACETWM_21745 [Candidatus Lokiarchaeia archaeon]